VETSALIDAKIAESRIVGNSVEVFKTPFAAGMAAFDEYRVSQHLDYCIR
jgi:hypothetical protein